MHDWSTDGAALGSGGFSSEDSIVTPHIQSHIAVGLFSTLVVGPPKLLFGSLNGGAEQSVPGYLSETEPQDSIRSKFPRSQSDVGCIRILIGCASC